MLPRSCGGQLSQADKLRIAKLPKHSFVSSEHLNLLVVQNTRTQCVYIAILIFHVEIVSFSRCI